MENDPASSNSMSVCERIFKAVSVSPVRTIRLISYRPQDATPASAASNTSMPRVKALHAQSKTVSSGQPESLVGCQRPETPEKKRAAEVVPIDFQRSITIDIDDGGFPPRSDKKEKSATPQGHIQNNSQAAKAAVKIDPVVSQSASVKENETKPKVQMIKSTKTVVGQGHNQAAITAGVEVAPLHVSVVEKPNPKATIVQQGKAVAGSGQGQLDIYTSNMEPEQPRVPGQERPKSKEEMASTTKVALEKTHGQGTKISSKVEHATSHVSVQDHAKAKPKVDKDSPAKIVKDQPLQNKTGEEGKNSGQYHNSDKFSDFINRTKLKIRATSDVGNTTPRVDSMNEKVSAFIDRAKAKLRSTSSIGGGKSASFK